MNRVKATLLAALATSAMPVFAASPAHWREISHQSIGGPGGWDLMTVDAAARRLYVTRSDRLMVIDLDHGSVVGEVPGLRKAHGVAVLADRRRGYVSSGGQNTLVVFDLDSLDVVTTIPVDGNPDAVVYDAHHDRVLVFNGDSSTASVIDPKNNQRVATIALPGKPELAVADDSGNVFVNLEDKAQVARIDVAAGRVSSVFALPGCEAPSGIAIDSRHERIFSVCQNQKMVVTDARNGRNVTSVPIGEGPDGAAFVPETNDVLSSNSDGTLSIVHEIDSNHFAAEPSLSTPLRSRCITVDAKTHRAILATGTFGDAPKATASNPHPRPVMQENSFGILVVGRR